MAPRRLTSEPHRLPHRTSPGELRTTPPAGGDAWDVPKLQPAVRRRAGGLSFLVDRLRVNGVVRWLPNTRCDLSRLSCGPIENEAAPA